MACTIIPATPSLTGAVSTAVSLLTTSTLSVYVASTSSPYSLDMSKLIVGFQANTSVASSMEFVVGDNFSGVGRTKPDAIAVSSDESVICVGGASFESARFLNSDGTVQFYNTGGTVLCYAWMLP